MKTNILRFSAVLLASATLFSCGGGMSAEEIQAEAQKKFDEAKVELQEEAAADCESNMAAYTAAALDSIKMAN
ncbi:MULTISPECIES: hypothetical protein [unclassified Aureispira]|uniref:hypothetical protein n=1 Tax=unclassified Aureispira TaxID=2649989 RepID=UPI00069914D3|nr:MULTISPECIES: hypothetical protein [unclassified Aureispira]WMX12534.1 hypothetical protein QP953_17020 [Aureispira sp. CCB-E]